MNTSSSLRVRVARKTTEATGICSFELAACDATALPAFSAGSHIDVHLPATDSKPALTRQYSLFNAPHETGSYQIAVLRDPTSRGGSAAMHALQIGDELQISLPKNHFELAHGAAHSLLLAGGIGITPLLCMAQRLAHSGADFALHYCTRSRERTAFYKRLQTATFSHQIAFHFDDGDAAQKLQIHNLLAAASPDTHLYVCGPQGFMDAVLGTARVLAWPEARVHFEFFGAAAPQASATDSGFEVQIASSGRIIKVPKDQKITQALADAGVLIPTSCEQGVCGTCLTRVISGVPDHKDLYLMPEEQAANDQFLPCCSRAKTARLVLDL